jgi:hypothetical protein
MKIPARFFLIIFFTAITLSTMAQFSKLIVFAPKGEKFTLVVGGTIQNSTPEARVEADVPGGPAFKFKVTFEDPSIKEISKTVFNKPNTTFYYKVDKNPKGVYAFESTSSEWSDVEKATEKTPPPAAKEQKPATTNEAAKSEPDKTTGEKGCANPIDEPSFLGKLISVSAPPYDPPKLSAAKKLATENCLTTGQVMEVMSVFDNESTSLSFAKFAYDHTWDIQNYSDVSEALHSSKSKKDFEAFINSKK